MYIVPDVLTLLYKTEYPCLSYAEVLQYVFTILSINRSCPFVAFSRLSQTTVNCNLNCRIHQWSRFLILCLISDSPRIIDRVCTDVSPATLDSLQMQGLNNNLLTIFATCSRNSRVNAMYKNGFKALLRLGRIITSMSLTAGGMIRRLFISWLCQKFKRIRIKNGTQLAQNIPTTQAIIFAAFSSCKTRDRRNDL